MRLSAYFLDFKEEIFWRCSTNEREERESKFTLISLSPSHDVRALKSRRLSPKFIAEVLVRISVVCAFATIFWKLYE